MVEPEVVTYIRNELRFPGLVQAAVLQKTCAHGSTETWYLLTSMTPEKLTPQAFLSAIRKHWHIENGLHPVNDRTLKEDDLYTQSPKQGIALAILRNAVVSLFTTITPPQQPTLSRPLQAIHYLTHPLKALKALQQA